MLRKIVYFNVALLKKFADLHRKRSKKDNCIILLSVCQTPGYGPFSRFSLAISVNKIMRNALQVSLKGEYLTIFLPQVIFFYNINQLSIFIFYPLTAVLGALKVMDINILLILIAQDECSLLK